MFKLWWQRRKLRKHGYVLVRNFLSPEVVELYKGMIDLSYTQNIRRPERADVLVGDIEAINKNIFDDMILLYKKDHVEKLFGVSMIPSYIFTREYFKGSELLIHTDREQCQYSVTVTLHKGGTGKSALVFCDDELGSNPVEIEMQEGDAILFNGAEAYGGKPHYRPKVELDSLVQTFLHYVRFDNGHTAQDIFPMPNYRTK